MSTLTERRWCLFERRELSFDTEGVRGTTRAPAFFLPEAGVMCWFASWTQLDTAPMAKMSASSNVDGSPPQSHKPLLQYRHTGPCSPLKGVRALTGHEKCTVAPPPHLDATRSVRSMKQVTESTDAHTLLVQLFGRYSVVEPLVPHVAGASSDVGEPRAGAVAHYVGSKMPAQQMTVGASERR